MYVPLLPFAAFILCWLPLNSFLDGASSLWEDSVGRSVGMASGRLQLPFGFIVLDSLITPVVAFAGGARLSV